jgi:signal transduction histidine kinase
VFLRVEGLTIKAALLLGFGLTMGLWLFAGYFFTRRMAEVQQDAALINGRYMHSQELLSTIRAQVLLASVYVRDALLDPDAATGDMYGRQVETAYHAIEAALDQYKPIVDAPEERERLLRLNREVEDYRATLLDVLSGDAAQWRADARNILRTRVVPQRELVIRVSDEVQALNRAAFVRQQSEIASIYRVTQRRVWQQLGLALAASFGIGLIATWHAGRLEGRIRRQAAKEAETTQDLQRLSSKLINAQEDERRAIARELHDEVGQVLTAIKMELALAQRAIDSGSTPAGILDPTRSITDGALQTVRDLSHLLHPVILDDLGLPAAIDWYLRRFGTLHGLRVSLRHEGMEGRLAAETEAAAYRIVQEALTNVVKHARARRCDVQLQRLPSSVLVTIEDDGIGFEADDPAQQHGLGLIGIRERAAHLRGTVRVESATGRGTRITVVLPAAHQTLMETA